MTDLYLISLPGLVLWGAFLAAGGLCIGAGLGYALGRWVAAAPEGE